MVDSMWSAVKGPVESGPICDKYENDNCVVVGPHVKCGPVHTLLEEFEKAALFLR